MAKMIIKESSQKYRKKNPKSSDTSEITLQQYLKSIDKITRLQELIAEQEEIIRRYFLQKKKAPSAPSE